MKLAALLTFLSLVLDGCNALRKPVDCNDILQMSPYWRPSKSGVYNIYPYGDKFAIPAYCDMTTADGGWTMIQRRMDGTLNFYRPWLEYKTGFGEVEGEHWLGLEFIHMLSNRSAHELLVEMEDFVGVNASARYSSFSVGSECDGYRLQVSGFTDGGAGNSLKSHNGMKFATFDRDTHPTNCAKQSLGAFWYNKCHTTNPNGVYLWGADSTISGVGIDWMTWKGKNYSLKAISMKIRPVVT